MSLDHARLLPILARWPQGRHGAAPGMQHFGFSGAIIVRVRTASGDLCLRGWPGNSPPPERLRGLHRLLAHVHDAGMTQVPVPLPTFAGKTLLAADCRWWQLEPWKVGTADFHYEPSDARLENTMAALAAFHEAAWGFEPAADEKAWFGRRAGAAPASVLERRQQLSNLSPEKIGRLRQALSVDRGEFARLAAELLQQAACVAPAVAAELDAAAAQPVPLGPCIRDVWHDHVLFTGDDVTGLIDLAACRMDNVAADLARLLGSLCGDDARCWDAALGAYQRHRPLSMAELGLVPILDRSGVLLSGLLWLERRYLRREPDVDWDRAYTRVEAIVSRLARMT